MSDELSKARQGAIAVRGEAKWNALQTPPTSVGKVLTSNGEADPSWETGGGGGITDILYADMVTAISAGTLSPGALYRITDYATTYYIVDGERVQYEQQTATVEPLIVQATSTNTIDKQAYCLDYPQDVIYYDWNPANWNTDLSFSDGEGTIIPNFKGVIYYRDDTLLNNIVGYDFRNVKFRRWAVDVPAWDDTSTYNKGDYVSGIDTDTYCYKALQAVPANTLVTNTAYWVPLLDLTVSLYWNAAPTSWNSIPSGTDYQDFYTFDGSQAGGNATYEKQCYSNNFAGIKDDKLNDNASGTLLGNNVIFLGDQTCYSNTVQSCFYCNTIDGKDFSSNTIGNNFYSNTIGNTFNANTIGNYFSFNTIGDTFNSNTIGTNFYSNTIGNIFNSNTIGNNFYSNTIGDIFNSNALGNIFYSNTIGNSFNNNTIGNSFYSNTIGNSFNNNTIGNSFNSNTIGNNLYSNTIGNYFTYNTIGNYFNSNTIGNGCYSNTIGNYFNSNTIGNNLYSNAIGNYFNYNTIGNNFYSNTIGNGCYSNAIGNYFNSNTIGNNFQSNQVIDNFNNVGGTTTGVDFTSATLVYQNYNKTLFKDSSSAQKLSYIDGTTGLLVVVAANA